MKNFFVFFALIIVLAAFSIPAQNKYVGAKVCASCHNKENGKMIFDMWQNSGHSKSYKSLTINTEKFNDIAKLWIVEMGNGEKYGLPTSAEQSKYCLPCHITTFGMDTQLIADSFNPKEGIQCESCHGPGFAHVEIETMKAKKQSIPGNEIASFVQIAKLSDFEHFDNEDVIRRKCEGCHNGTCGSFDFNKMWPMIKH